MHLPTRASAVTLLWLALSPQGASGGAKASAQPTAAAVEEFSVYFDVVAAPCEAGCGETRLRFAGNRERAP